MHYSDDELSTMRKDRSQAAHEAAIEKHLAECAECRETLALFGELEESLHKAEVWERVPAFQAPPKGLQEILAEKAAIERQNAEALRRLAPHLKSPLHFEDANVAENARFRDAGVVRMLTAEAAGLRERKPKFALQLATAACVVARKLDAEPLFLAAAIRERANALRFVGRFKEALTALDEAEAIFRRLPSGAFDLAIVEYVRATVVIQFEERSAEALELARSAIRTFREYGDRQRELAARLVEAEALRIVRGSADAANAYEEVITLAQRTEQRNILAYGFQNSAIAYADLGDIEKAERYFAEALAIYDELGVTVEQVRTQWEMARMLVLRGKLESGAGALELARQRLRDLELREDHALATLDWAGVRLALNRADGVAAACREIMLEYESEGATKNARLALAYVEEALRHGSATPRLVRQVPRHSIRQFLVPLLTRRKVATLNHKPADYARKAGRVERAGGRQIEEATHSFGSFRR
jgi:tetratricopeptide (TPR) repeat protein